MKCQAHSKHEECKGEIQTVHIWDRAKYLGTWNYCEDEIKAYCIDGFQIYDMEGNQFEYIPEQFRKIKKNENSR